MKLPSKTFILGEYVVLDGGPGLILTTPPYFELSILDLSQKQNTRISNSYTLDVPRHGSGIQKKIKHAWIPLPCRGTSAIGTTLVNAIHPQSPAGNWIKKHAEFFNRHQIDFYDPHQGKGGFGASSAQFLALYNITDPIQKELSTIQTLLEAYWSTFSSEIHPLPSGADLVAQLFGNVVYWHRNQQQIASYNWPFKDLAYCLIHTGQKKSTHENLSHLPKASALTQMTHIVENGHAAFKSQNESAFIAAIQDYAYWMQQAHCVIPETQAIITALYQSKLILAAKGCGALGADVILILVDLKNIDNLIDWLNQQTIAIAFYKK